MRLARTLAVATLVLAGCSQASFYRRPTAAETRTLIWEDDLTLEQQTFLLTLRDEPTAFVLPADKADDAWSRAKAFVDRYGGMKVRKANAYEIKTHAAVAPAGFVPKLCRAGYHLTRVPEGKMFYFTIRTAVCAPDWVPCEIGRLRNARILARYLRTGKLEHPELIQR